MKLRLVAFGVGLLLWIPSLLLADESAVTAKFEKLEPPKELKDTIRSLLSDEALVVRDAKDVVMSTMWFRKEIPAKATAQQVKNGLTYREIEQSTLVGALQLPAKWIDYRKQEIPKGVYTLRFGMQPQDGDHMGTAPHNEFCLLCPADKDTTPALMAVKALHELSATSHGATHPAVLLLFPNPKPEDTPKVISKGKGIFVANLKRTLVAAGEKTTLGFGLTVAGHTTE